MIALYILHFLFLMVQAFVWLISWVIPMNIKPNDGEFIKISYKEKYFKVTFEKFSRGYLPVIEKHF